MKHCAQPQFGSYRCDNWQGSGPGIQDGHALHGVRVMPPQWTHLKRGNFNGVEIRYWDMGWWCSIGLRVVGPPRVPQPPNRDLPTKKVDPPKNDIAGIWQGGLVDLQNGHAYDAQMSCIMQDSPIFWHCVLQKIIFNAERYNVLHSVICSATVPHYAFQNAYIVKLIS